MLYAGHECSTKFRVLFDWPEYRVSHTHTTYSFVLPVISVDIDLHGHLVVIPSGTIDGDNRQFLLPYFRPDGRFEVMLNGLNIPYVLIPGGFELDMPPRPGDYLWCQVVV